MLADQVAVVKDGSLQQYDEPSRLLSRPANEFVARFIGLGRGYRWLQVFTGETLGPRRRRRALAIEPMTCPPNAFVQGDDVLVLEPGQAVTHTWGIQVLSD